MTGTMKLLLSILTAVLLGGVGLGQAGLADLQQAAQAARESGQPAHPDQNAWRDAIRTGEQARRAEPESAQVARLLAELYSEVAWYSRAFATWLDYSELSGEPPAAEPFAEAAHQLGFARYSFADLQGALHYYDALLEHQPDNAEALFWSGRIRLELGDGEGAEAAFDRLLQLDSADGVPVSQAQLAGNVAGFGPEAALAFSQGISLYEAGQLEAALERFQAAFEADRSFADAAVWSGRTALELGDPGLAAGYWRWATELNPEDSRSQYFLELAERQDRWGTEAAAAFDRGAELYAAGELSAALAAFEEAAGLSPGYVDALSWSARVAQELGRHDLAADYWQQVLRHDPGDEGARYFLNLAEQRLSFGGDVSDAFLRALDLYRQADFAGAEAELTAVTEEFPEFAPAWGYLGQIHFARGEYRQAAAAFERARELEPGNDEYVFFAMEARRLARSPD